jgi:hypothetical protein
MRTLRIVSFVALGVCLSVFAGCGHQTALVPVDSPLVQWQPPEDLQSSTPESGAPAPAKPEAAPAKPAAK